MLTDFFTKRKNIKIILPNFHNFVFLNLCFITLQENNKEVFKKHYVIDAAQGCFPYSIWSNERERQYITQHDMITTINLYSKHKIKIQYLFDNSSITKNDLYDNYSNLMLKLAHKAGNGVFVKSKILYDYIKEKYPLYQVIKIAAPDEFNMKNIAVMNKYNNIIKKNDIKYRDSAYITLNPMCPADCKHYDDHIKYIEQEQLGYHKISNIYICPLKIDFNFYELKNNSNFITEEKLKDYINAGFKNFKIEYPNIKKATDVHYDIYDTIESYIYYMIKPEFKQEVRHIITKKFTEKKNG